MWKLLVDSFHWAVDGKTPTDSNDLQSHTIFLQRRQITLLENHHLHQLERLPHFCQDLQRIKSWVPDLTGEHGKDVEFLQ